LLSGNIVEGRKYTYDALGYYGSKIGCFEIREGKAVTVGCEDRDVSLEAELAVGLLDTPR
jgi:hypothetical protein